MPLYGVCADKDKMSRIKKQLRVVCFLDTIQVVFY